MTVDPVRLTADLIRCPSVTPTEGGALKLLVSLLSGAGFECHRVDRNGTPNLFARWGQRGAKRTFGFNGHTDVVPIGAIDAWTVDPFGGDIKNGILYGRGATDMKSGVAAFAAAAVDFVKETPPDGAIILAITGDEEGVATDGTVALLDWMNAQGEAMEVCLVGEPTCPEVVGEMIKVGRRGSMTIHFTVNGKQGHSAYPHRAVNPLPAMAELVSDLSRAELDQGSEHFDPSTLAFVTIDTGNPASNVIPAQTRATANIRFNDIHSGQTLTELVKKKAAGIAQKYNVEIETQIVVSGESFLTPPGQLSELVSNAIKTQTGLTPILSTTGGTSDARFIKSHCPVVEFGLVGKTMHQVDERVPIEQITALKAIYSRILHDYFS